MAREYSRGGGRFHRALDAFSKTRCAGGLPRLASWLAIAILRPSIAGRIRPRDRLEPAPTACKCPGRFRMEDAG